MVCGNTSYELAQVIGRFGDTFIENYSPNAYVQRTLRAIQHCRISSLGGHIDQCDVCGYIRISYNSCRNRHCPKCQNTHREAWIENRKLDLLPVPYFHVVFTVPDKLNRLFITSASGTMFLFNVKNLSVVFRGKFMAGLVKQIPQEKTFIRELYQTGWVVYAKEPYAGPEQMEYLGCYTHKVAISNHRLLNTDESGVRFRYRDYRDDRQKEMTLGGAEFLRQFCQHILPKGFVRIRHYGLLSTAKRPELRELQQAFGLSVPKVIDKKNWKQICGCISITTRTAAPAVGKAKWLQLECIWLAGHHLTVYPQ